MCRCGSGLNGVLGTRFFGEAGRYNELPNNSLQLPVRFAARV